MNSGKTVFQEFVEANQGLLNCYNAVSLDEFKKMNEGQKELLCNSHKTKLRDILGSNQLVMSNLIRDRIEILKKLGAEQEIIIRK